MPKLIIGTEMDNSKFEKQLADLEKKLSKKQAEIVIKTKNVEATKQQLEIINKEVESLENEINSISKDAERLAELEFKLDEGQNLSSSEGAEYAALSMSKVNEREQELLNKLYNLNQEQDKLNTKLDTQNQKLKDAKDDYNDINLKINEIKNNQNKIPIDIDKIGNKINGILKKITKWGLAVFGVRSAYLAIRQAMSIIASYNPELAADIEYIKYALAHSIKPVVKWIVDAVKALLQYLNYIWYAWFKKPLFPGIKDFTSNTNKANSAAKKLQKTLAGFDEINMLQDNSSSGGGGITAPTFDLGNVDEVKIPKWVKWIADNKETVLTLLGALAATFAASTIAKWVKNLAGLSTALGYGSTGILGLLQTIMGIGAIVITITIAKKIWDEADQLKKDIREIRKSGAEYQKEYIANEKNIQSLLSTSNANRQAGYDILKKTGPLWVALNGLGWENLETAKQTAITIGWQIDKEVELWKTSGKNKEEQEKIKQNIYDQYLYNLKVIEGLKKNGYETGQIEVANEKLIENYKEMGGKVSIVKSELDDVRKIKFDNKKLIIDVSADATKFKEELKKAYEYANKLIGGLGFSFGGGGKGSSGHGGGGGSRAKGGIYYPKLAVGGIINQPGRGVPYHGATIGERGAEAVVPLTDSQQMALLGEAIGKYITINANIVNTMNGRVISKELQKVQNDNNFAFNR